MFLSRKYIFLYLVLIVSILVHYSWFSLSIFAFGDWQFTTLNTWSFFRDHIFSTNSTWYASYDFGFPVRETYFFYLFLLRDILSIFGNGYSIGLLLIYQLPIIILAPLGSYFLIKVLLKDNFLAFMGSLYYTFTSYFLVLQTQHLTLGLAYALAPITLAFAYNFLLNDEKRVAKFVWLALIVAIQVSLEPRIFYILIIFLLPLAVKIKIYWKYFLVSAIFVILLSTFWLFPTLTGGTEEIISLINRPLFGSQYQSIFYSFTNMHNTWTGIEPIVFSKQNIQLYFWMIPLIIFSGLLFSRNKRSNEWHILYFYITALVGILLIKQESVPFVQLYQWLYDNFPGFNLFRESSKFYIITSLSFAILIPYSFNKIRKWLHDKNKNFLIFPLVFAIALVTVVNALPVITGEINIMFKPRYLTADFRKLNANISGEVNYSRNLVVPNHYHWITYDQEHPRLGLVRLAESIFNISETADTSMTTHEKLLVVLKQKYSDSLLDLLSIKRVVLPDKSKLNHEDIFLDYGGRENPNIRQWYIGELDKLDYLERVDIGTKELVVYENKNYRPYIVTLSELNNFESFENLEDKYSFAVDTLSGEFDFVQSEDVTDFPTKRITTAFEQSGSDNLLNNTIRQIATSTANVEHLYTDTNRRTVTLQPGVGLIARSGGIFLADGKLQSEYVARDILYKDGRTPFYAKASDKLVRSNEEAISKAKGIPIEIYEAQPHNAINNPSFEKSLWDEKVGDCNNYDKNGLLDMKNVNGVLQLEATRHIACTSQSNIAVQAGKEYVFEFDYQGENTKLAGYHISFKGSTDEERKNQSKKLSITDSEWHTHRELIEMPPGTKSISLHVYAYATDNVTNNIVRYDNFNLREVEKVETIEVDNTPKFEKVELPKPKDGKYTFEYRDPEHDFSNKIPDASFEKGGWGSKVGDCHNYDDNPQIGMRYANVASDGKRSLELQAARHIACLSTGGLQVEPGATYLFEFDYQSANAKRAGFNIGFNNEEKTNINEKPEVEGSDWQTYKGRVKVPNDADTLTLHLYSYPKNETENIITRYDNLKLIELPDIENRYWLVSEPEEKFEKPREVTFELVNPTKKLVHIKGATTPFYLAMSESYHDKWQLQFNNNKVNGFFEGWVPFVSPDAVPDEHHFELNGFLNGWYVDTARLCNINDETQGVAPLRAERPQTTDGCTLNADGSYDMEFVIEFTPQRWFYLGLLISGTTFVSLVGYLVYDTTVRVRALRRRARQEAIANRAKRFTKTENY